MTIELEQRFMSWPGIGESIDEVEKRRRARINEVGEIAVVQQVKVCNDSDLPYAPPLPGQT